MTTPDWFRSAFAAPTRGTVGAHINIISHKARRSQAEMEQIILYVKPFLNTGASDREIYDLLDANNKLERRTGGIKTTYRTVQNIINRARKKFKIYNPRGKYAVLNDSTNLREKNDYSQIS